MWVPTEIVQNWILVTNISLLFPSVAVYVWKTNLESNVLFVGLIEVCGYSSCVELKPEYNTYVTNILIGHGDYQMNCGFLKLRTGGNPWARSVAKLALAWPAISQTPHHRP